MTSNASIEDFTLLRIRGPVIATAVHQLLRRRVHGGRDQDSRQPAAGTQSERDLRTDDRYPAPGTLGPGADRQ